MNVKAFELVSVLERSHVIEGFKSQASSNEIVCMDCCVRHCFLGSSHGLIVHYILEEKRKSGRILYVTYLQGKKLIIQKKTIQSIKFVAAVDKIIVLTDNVMFVLNLGNLEVSSGHDKLKNVHTFCVDEQKDANNPFGRQVCVASKKKHFQLYNLTAEKWIHIRDLGLPEPPVNVSMDGHVLCTALQTKYMLVNTETAKLLDLFPYDRELDTPFVKLINRGEFLLGGPSSLGMFVNSAGVSHRPPMQLKEEVVSVGFSKPYIVSLNSQFLVIHSVIDQQQKQAIPFQRGVCLCELNDRILVASSHDVYAMVPVPWETQVQGLLADQRVEEALSLAQVSSRNGSIPQDQFKKLYSRFLQIAGFIEFSLFNFDQARQYFTEGAVDPREVISLFPNLLSDDSDFSRSRPALHEFADVVQITKGGLNKLEDCKAFITRFLENYRYQYIYKKDVHTALMKLYAENNSEKLQKLIEDGCQCSYHDCIKVLQTYGRFHCLAVYYQKKNELDKALSIWSRLVNEEIEDDCFSKHGLPYFVSVLSKMTNLDLVFNYAHIVLKKDEVLGAQIFVGYTSTLDDKQAGETRSKSQAITDYLERYPQSLILYLEHVISKLKSTSESYHSRLAMVYLDELNRMHKQIENDDESRLSSLRCKLQKFLKDSSLYSVNLILGRVERDEWLLLEAAILYGKTEQHEKALDVLVCQLENYEAAEEYCVSNSKDRSTAYRQNLFETLLRIYLSKAKTDEKLRIPALDLLNSSNSSFNAAKAAELIPEDWSIAILSKFLLNSVRSSLHDGRQLKIARQLAYRDYYLAKKEHLELESKTVAVVENTRCSVCHQLFKESKFTRLTNGSIAHIKCSKT